MEEPGPVTLAQSVPYTSPPVTVIRKGASLDIGCGESKRGEIGMDLFQGPGVDVVWDLRDVPWPFASDTFTTVYASHVLEHIPRSGDCQFQEVLFKVMDEVHRVLEPGGRFIVAVPHEDSREAWGVPTHQRVFNETSWTYFSRDLWKGKANGRMQLEGPVSTMFSSATVRVDREFGSHYGIKEWHVERHLPRLYRFLCWLRIGRKRNMYVEFIK